MLKVSVIIPNYNCEPYLKKAIESILNQTYQNFELLICDDGSTDDSLSIIKYFQRIDNRVRILENKKNRGYLYTYNRLLFEAEGDYIIVQDADDWSDHERIRKQVAVLETYDVDLCLTNFDIYDSSKGTIDYKVRSYSGFIEIEDEDRWGAPATIMFKRQILNKVPGFNIYYDRLTGMDRYFLLEILSHYKGFFLDEYLYHVLARSDSDHRSINMNDKFALRKMIALDVYKQLKQQRILTGTDWLHEKDFKSISNYENQLIENRILVSEKFRVFACTKIDHKQFKLAFPLLVVAISKAPFYFKNYKTLFYLLRSIAVELIA